MSTHSWCHGPYCHQKQTQDRVRGVKGSKVLRTRKVRWYQSNVESKWNYFCGNTCLHDYINEHLQAFIRIAPRREPLETPIDFEQRKVNDRRYNWETREHEDYVRTEKTIIPIDNVNR
jgi:hypothetical protein